MATPEILLSTNKPTYMPAGHMRQLDNSSIVDSIYLNEDDTVRLQDLYGRV